LPGPGSEKDIGSTVCDIRRLSLTSAPAWLDRIEGGPRRDGLRVAVVGTGLLGGPRETMAP